MLTTRSQFLNAAFPEGVPSLWCPPLTHYTAEGAIDHARIQAHLRFLASWVKGLLVPGTTGDAWELSPVETRELIGLMLDQAPPLKLHVLWGALHPDAARARELIVAGLDYLKERFETIDAAAVLRRSGVCGFAVCPPRGASLSEMEMEASLSRILELGVPLALYQLPQVTQNEMSPAMVARLAARFANFVLLKDTSGGDRVAEAGVDLGGVFLVRGMEGAYARWLKLGGGCYDGFLLSSANAFCRPLHDVREWLEQGRRQEAQALSARLSSVIDALFAIADAAAGGNKFTNANKLADHFYAHGPGAASLPPPRLHSGHGLTPAMVSAAGKVLEEYGLMPAKGYLE